MTTNEFNPFESKTVTDDELTRQQRSALLFYQRFQNRSPSSLEILLSQIWEVLLTGGIMMIPMGIIIALSMFTLDESVRMGPVLFLGGISLGYVLGYLAKTHVTARTFAKLWPLLHTIISWQVVDRLLDGRRAPTEEEATAPLAAEVLDD